MCQLQLEDRPEVEVRCLVIRQRPNCIQQEPGGTRVSTCEVVDELAEVLRCPSKVSRPYGRVQILDREVEQIYKVDPARSLPGSPFTPGVVRCSLACGARGSMVVGMAPTS